MDTSLTNTEMQTACLSLNTPAGNTQRKYVLRPYQQQAVDAAKAYFSNKKAVKPVLIVMPTGSGKSLILASIAESIDAPLLVFQPTKEILEQNYNKMMDYGIFGVTIYSASMKQKEIGNITLATIGSVYRKPEDFRQFKYILIDECHQVNAKADGSMYKRFIDAVGEKIIGLTATPYRLSHDGFGGSILKFLTRTNPRVFSKVIHVTQTKELSFQGYFCKTEYYSIKGFQRGEILLNSTGADYLESSEREYYTKHEFNKSVLDVVKRLLKVGKKRILVFTKFVEESRTLAEELGSEAAMVNGEMKAKDRDAVIKGFKSGQIKVVCNVGVLTTGFDYPELECVVVARPTRSLTLYYQMCLDMQTEILTKRGFLKHNEISHDDKVASFDNGKVIWSDINEIIYRPVAEGESFIAFKNQHLDFRVTGDHTMLAKSMNMKVYQKETALEMCTRTTLFEVPVSGIEEVQDCWLSDDEIRFLGFFLSDGCLGKVNNAIAIVQSLRYPHVIAEIERVLISCGFKYGKIRRKRKGAESKYPDVYHFTVSKGIPRGRDKDKKGWAYLSDFIDKNLSPSYETLSSRQLSILLEAINMGDGKKFVSDKYQVGTYSLCMGDNKTYTERIQSLCVRRGYRCNVYTQRCNGFHDQYIMYVKQRQTSTIAGSNVQDNLIEGKPSKRTRLMQEAPNDNEYVWCVNTDIGTIVTRRNGKPLIMGNCGRCVRPHPSKESAWIIDMCGNYEIFGKMEDMKLVEYGDNLWTVVSNGRQLTNCYLDKIMKN